MGRRYATSKFECTLRFELNDYGAMSQDEKLELKEFIADALESWGGQRHPDDWLFGSLEKVKVLNLKRKVP